MTLNHPFQISSRLLPGIKVGDAWIQLEYSPISNGGRQCYIWTIDVANKTFSGADLRSGCQGGNLQDGFESLLSFLVACGESVGYQIRTGGSGDNKDLFPTEVAEWAYQNSDELRMAAFELEENKTAIVE